MRTLSSPSLRGPETKLWRLAAVGLILIAVFALMHSSGLLQRVEWLVQDAFQQMEASAGRPNPDLCFVVVDQRSLDAASREFNLSWPWPREAYGQVLDYLHLAGARWVLFDFYFTEPSFYGVEDDQVLAQAFARSRNVFLPVLAKSSGLASSLSDLEQARPDVFVKPYGRPPSGQRLSSLTLPIPDFLQCCAGVGDVRWNPDADGVVRRIKPLVRVGEKVLPQLGFAPLMQKIRPGRIALYPGRLQVGGRNWPLDTGQSLRLRFPGYWKAYPHHSAIDVITSNVAVQEGSAPKLSPALFKNKVVVIGSIAEGLLDLKRTPLEAQTPAFYLSAAAWAAGETGQAYNERWQPRLKWPLLLLLVALGLMWGRLSPGRGLLGYALTLLALAGGVTWLFFFRHILLDLVTPALELSLAYGAGLGLTYYQVQQQKHFIQGAFSQILSPTVLAGLMREPQRLAVGGEVAGITVYFSDLAGFTEFSEALPPQKLVEVLNLYLDEMVETIVSEYAGYVDKFIGDAVMAFWGAPLPDGEQTYHACAAALRNQEKLQGLQDRLRSLGLTSPLSMRIGLHTGPAIVGMMGSPKKLNYTVMGDTVNLASRLESVNKQFGTRILMSADTWMQVQGRFTMRLIDRIRVKGKSEPTPIYELVGRPEQAGPAVVSGLAAFEQGLAAYWRRDFKNAQAYFRQTLKHLPDDQPARIFIDRCRQYRQNPPPEKWDGVTTLTSK